MVGYEELGVQERARRAYEAHDWGAAVAALREMDGAGEAHADGPDAEGRNAGGLKGDGRQGGGLDAEDLERLSWAARWAGEYEAALEPLERAYAAFADRGEVCAAARVALDLCHMNYDRQNHAMSSGWWMQAQWLLESQEECAEHGRLAWYLGRTFAEQGNAEAWHAKAEEAESIGRRVQARDVEALGLVDRGHALVALGRPREGVPLLDQAAAQATGGRLGLHAAGIVFCSVVWACRARSDWERAREWTDAVNRWCARERIGYFPGLCQLHRSEVLRLSGALEAAEQESLRACDQLLVASPSWAGAAFSELGEIRRRRGDSSGASEAFRRSIELGWDPQPGFARLLLSQGDAAAGLRAVRRALSDTSPVSLREDRAVLLALKTTLALAAGEPEEAASAAHMLAQVAADDDIAATRALADGAAGEVALHEARFEEAVARLRTALRQWTDLGAPYEAAQVRALLADALSGEGDEAAAEIEREAARRTFERIDAPAEGPYPSCAAKGAEVGSEIAGDASNAARGAPNDAGASNSAGNSDPAHASVERIQLLREGEYWSIHFHNQTRRFKDARGLRYLARLLQEPGREIAVTELATGEAGVAHTSDAGERLDRRAIADYRAHLNSLRGELEEAERWNDTARATQLREEMETIAAELAGATGLGGRRRRDCADTERARQAVTKAIRSAIRRIGTEFPELGDLLGRTIRTGTFCCCEADPLHRVRWEVQQEPPLTS